MVYAKSYRRKRRTPSRSLRRKFRRRVYRRRYRMRRGRYGIKSYSMLAPSKSSIVTYNVSYPVQITSSNFTDFAVPIRLNSAYDPWNGILGKANALPAGYELWSTLYGWSCVTGVKAVVTLRQRNMLRPHAFSTEVVTPGVVNMNYPLGTTFQNPAVVWGTQVSNVSTVTSTTDYWPQRCSDPNVKHKTIQNNLNGNASSTIVVKWSARKWFNTRDILGNIEEYGAVTNGNPTQTVYLAVWGQIADYSYQPPESMQFDVFWNIKMKVHWSKPLNISALPAGARLNQAS